MRVAASIIVTSLALLGAAGEARGQRGGDYVRHSGTPESPQSGMPGFFDTAVAGKGKLVADLPFLSLSYGVTERLTLGTSLLFALPNLQGTPAGLLSARYSAYADDGVVSAFTAYAGGATGSDADGKGDTWLALSMVTSNTSLRIGQNQVTLHVLGFHSFGSQTQDTDGVAGTVETDLGLTILGGGVSYTRFLGERWALMSTVFTAPYVRGTTASSFSSVDLALATDEGFRELTVARLVAEYRTEGRAWLFTFGALVRPFDPAPIPWLGLTWSP